MENFSKKEIKEQYKNRIVIGGVYCIKCNGNGRTWIKSTKDITGQINKLNFFVSTNSCPEPGMYSEWNQYGANSFSFTILEEIKKGETQTDREFAEDICVLYDMWMEKQQQESVEI
ncbi:GIY-YIG nuclease family protein [Anaerocolumna xylanovorans]|uniref:GIY-YIG nuclease family protein n=1 Tax=Anaerocolumna xylanovorans DSM 12503 TaxID=1121345 RepID=A0A1M7Y0J3_9FIRM|nr:GIY-YIG nuclease family protein [Anaerocolumna xylanovorans]SHO45085.1 hypothetical protein SAMN02745217_00819 [Anaerocolumna xylanovorans DSM 12503]